MSKECCTGDCGQGRRCVLNAQPEQAKPTDLLAPDGWKLVPISPTLEMTEAGRDARLAGATNMDSLVQWRAMLATCPAPPAQQQPVAVLDTIRDAVRDSLSAALGEAMDCTRVWAAWRYKTMGEDDFQLVADNDERLDEILDAVLSHLTTPHGESDKTVGSDHA